MSPVIETEEHKALRTAVAALGQKYGRAYLAAISPARAATPTSCGPTPPSSAISASACPRSTAAVAAASPNCPSSSKSSGPRAAPSS